VRWRYNYTQVSNGLGAEKVALLNTITVPSPTGTGNSMKKIMRNWLSRTFGDEHVRM